MQSTKAEAAASAPRRIATPTTAIWSKTPPTAPPNRRRWSSCPRPSSATGCQLSPVWRRRRAILSLARNTPFFERSRPGCRRGILSGGPWRRPARRRPWLPDRSLRGLIGSSCRPPRGLVLSGHRRARAASSPCLRSFSMHSFSFLLRSLPLGGSLLLASGLPAREAGPALTLAEVLQRAAAHHRARPGGDVCRGGHRLCFTDV